MGRRGIHQAPDFTGTVHDSSDQRGAELASPANPVNGITINTVANARCACLTWALLRAGLGDDHYLGDSKYNSLQATVRKQISHGLQLQAAYTYSRSFTTEHYVTIANPTLLLPTIRPDARYRPQRLTVNYGWDLPFGKHEGFVGKIASGWNLSGVTVVQDGTPLTVTDTRGGTIYGFGPGSTVTSTAEFAAGMSAANVATPGGVEAAARGHIRWPGLFQQGRVWTHTGDWQRNAAVRKQRTGNYSWARAV